MPNISDDEAIATRATYGGMIGGGPEQVGGMMPPQTGFGNIPMMANQFHDQYGNHQFDPPVDGDVAVSMNHHKDENSSVTSALMGGAQNWLKQKRMNRV